MIAVTPTTLEGVLVIQPKVFRDPRGFFLETFQAERYADIGVVGPFVQDNCSFSARGTLRGLHFQQPNGQGKLVQVLAGSVFDVAVDVREGSPTFGQWVGVDLDGESARQLWVPPGFAHGFCVTSEKAIFLYKCTDFYAPDCERVVAWNDPDLGIHWPIAAPVLSRRDEMAPRLRDLEVLPEYR